jgi:hypothetical protein
VLGLQITHWLVTKIRRTPYPFLEQDAVPR